MNYIPAKDADFNVFFEKVVAYVAAKTGGTPLEWTHIPADAKTALLDASAAWSTAYSKTLNEHSSQDTREKQGIRGHFEAFYPKLPL